MPKVRLEEMLDAVSGVDRVLILPHHNPDPDAIASAIALSFLLAERPGIPSDVAYRGIVGRAENRALVRYLDFPLQRLADLKLGQETCVAVVDAQPGAGNITLPTGSRVAIVFDHHPLREDTAPARFADVRPDVGATSTILTEYLRAARLKPAPQVATALFYGIKADTLGLTRATSPADAAAFCYLQSLVDMKALSTIERAQVPPDYFKTFAAALQVARVYDQVVVAHMGPVDYPDLTAELADILLRLKGVQWVICTGTHQDVLVVAVRTLKRRGAGQLVQGIVGLHGTAGGHGELAGGQMPLGGQNAEPFAQELIQRALRYLGVPPDVVGVPLT